MKQPYPKAFLNTLLDTASSAGIASATFRKIEKIHAGEGTATRARMMSLVSLLIWEIETAGALFYGPSKVA